MRHLYSFSIIIYLLCRFLDAEEKQYAPVIFDTYAEQQERGSDDDGGMHDHYHNILINFMIITIGFFKLMRYMTVFSELGQIILMV